VDADNEAEDQDQARESRTIVIALMIRPGWAVIIYHCDADGPLTTPNAEFTYRTPNITIRTRIQHQQLAVAVSWVCC